MLSNFHSMQEQSSKNQSIQPILQSEATPTETLKDSLESTHSKPRKKVFLSFASHTTIQSIHQSFQPQPQQDSYSLNSKILDKSSISNLHRARLKYWLIFELTNCRFYRQTYAAASKYFDLFFACGNDIEVASLQLLGLSCFLLAAKVVQNRIPPISYKSFSKDKILEYEKIICFSSKFKLNPVTYVTAGQLLMLSWDVYSNLNNHQYGLKYYSSKKQSILNFRSFMEILDSIYLTLQSLDFHEPSLVAALFYFQHRRNVLQLPHPTTTQQVSSIYNNDDEYNTIFNNFVEFSRKYSILSEVSLEEQTLNFVLPFLQLKTRIEETIPRNKSYLRHYLSLQTYNEEAYSVAKQQMLSQKY